MKAFSGFISALESLSLLKQSAKSGLKMFSVLCW